MPTQGVMPNLLKFIQVLLQACQQIFLQEKKMKKDREARTCQQRGIAASKNMKHWTSWKFMQVPEDFTSCKGSKVAAIWALIEPCRQDKRSDLYAEAGLCLYFCYCQAWGKLAPAGFSFPQACWCSLLRLITHVRLSPASCRVRCWDTSVWCQVSWSLHSRKARVAHTHTHTHIWNLQSKLQAHTQIPVGHTHALEIHPSYARTNAFVLGQMVDHHGSVVSTTWSIILNSMRSTGETFLPNNWRRGSGRGLRVKMSHLRSTKSEKG